MIWANFFKMYVHAYDPVTIEDGRVVHINIILMYPIQSLWYDIRRYGLTIAWENFNEVMRL